MNTASIRSRLGQRPLLLGTLLCLLGLFACTLGGKIGSGSVLPQDWDKRRGPVVPHDDFPKDCSLCHIGGSWSLIREDFAFEHEKETGVALHGTRLTGYLEVAKPLTHPDIEGKRDATVFAELSFRF